MKKNFRRRFWIEIASASTTSVLALITLIFPDWIEFVSGLDPDQHGGSAEWLIVGGLILITILVLALAATEWRRAPLDASA